MEENFSGGVFSESLSNGRAGAEIVLTPSGVRATVPDGTVFEVPYRDCQIEIGGFNGRMVFCRNPDKSVTIFCEEKKFPKSLSLLSSGMLDTQLGTALKQVRGQSRRGFAVGMACLVGLLLCLVGGYFAIRHGAVAAIHALPVSVDRQIGDAAFEAMDLGGPEINDPEIVGAVQKMVDRLAPHSAIDGLEYEVHVVDSDQMNAFCLPGGIMVVYTGLMKGAKNAEQVSAVVGHEMAHATLRHGMERTAQSLGIYAAVSLVIGDVGGVLATGADLFTFAAVNAYSRGQEEAADAEGLRMLHEAGIDPSAMAEFFAILEHEHGDIPGVFAWISTHPRHSERIESVREAVAELPKKEYTSIDVDWQDIQNRLKGNANIEEKTNADGNS